MRGSDRAILLVLPLIAAVIGFWLLVIGPKRTETSELQTKAADLQVGLTEARAKVSAGEAAKADYQRNYVDLVSLGNAAPNDGAQATLVYDISNLGQDNDVRFRSFAVMQSSGAEATAAPAPAPTTPAPTTGTPTAATPTEASVATLPIGAAVGPAGLPVMPYDFKFLGNFFNVADFFADIDRQVEVAKAGGPGLDGPLVSVNGRLLTVNGFALTANPKLGFPDVQADFSVTTYAVPPEPVISGDATATEPAPVVVGAPATEGSTAAPAAAVSP